jgi:hypothetical protein
MIYYITSFFFTWILLFWFLSQKTVKETIIPIKENYEIKQQKITILTFNIQKFPLSIKDFQEII